MTRKENEQFIFGSVFLLANKLQTAGDRVISEITVKQWFLLLMIHHMNKPSPSITEITDYIGSTRQNVKKMTDILEEKSFVEVTRDESDRRNLCVHLTDTAMDFFQCFDPTGERFLDELFREISTESLQQVSQVFTALFSNLEKEETGGQEREAGQERLTPRP